MASKKKPVRMTAERRLKQDLAVTNAELESCKREMAVLRYERQTDQKLIVEVSQMLRDYRGDTLLQKIVFLVASLDATQSILKCNSVPLTDDLKEIVRWLVNPNTAHYKKLPASEYPAPGMVFYKG